MPQRSKNKTIFITVAHSFISKNILNTGVLDMLLAEKHIKVVLIVPLGKEDFFKQQYAEKVVIQPIDSRLILKSGLIKAFRTIGYLLVDSHYLWYKEVERRNTNRTHPSAYPKYFLKRVFTKVCAGRKNIQRLYRRLYMQHTAVNNIERLFDAYKPDLLFATDIFDEIDGLLIRQAKHTNVPSVGMVRSWDNCYSKGILKAIPDTVIVNNETLKRELVDIHGIDEDIIYPVGVPQYDHLLKIPKLEARRIFAVNQRDSGRQVDCVRSGGEKVI